MVELVPARVVSRVVEPEVRADVEQGGPTPHDLAGHLRGHAVRQRGEYGVCLGDRLIDDQPRLTEVRVRGGDRLVVAVAAIQTGELDVGVMQKQSYQLAARVPGRAQDADGDGTAVCRAEGPRS